MPGAPLAMKLAMLAVLVMCPPVTSPERARAFIRGAKGITPLMTPPRLTPSTQSQSSYELSSIAWKRVMPALLNTRLTGPNAASTSSAVPVGVRARRGRREEVDAGVVEHQAARADRGLDLVRGGSEACAVHHIEPAAHDLAIVEAGERRVDRVLADVGDRHFAALIEQVAHDPESDAVGAAGDESRAAGEVDHRPPPIASTGLPGPLSRPGRNSL